MTEAGSGYAEVVARLRERLGGREPRRVALDSHRAAAVAVLLVDRGGEAYVPLTVRSMDLRQHSGQIALPGGVRDDGDVSFAATALRESWEELGIDPARLEVIGMLDDVPTPTGFVITPVVTLFCGSQVYAPNPSEVSDVFEAPLHLFSQRDTAEVIGEREMFGFRYTLRAYHFKGHRIWGATARILEGLSDLVRG